MIHTFEQICTRTLANPNETAPEAAMPQAAWETPFRDAVQGLRPPYTPETLSWWLQTTHPRAPANGAPQASPPLHNHHGGKRKGKEWLAAMGRGEGQGSRQAPTGTGH